MYYCLKQLYSELTYLTCPFLMVMSLICLQSIPQTCLISESLPQLAFVSLCQGLSRSGGQCVNSREVQVNKKVGQHVHAKSALVLPGRVVPRRRRGAFSMGGHERDATSSHMRHLRHRMCQHAPGRSIYVCVLKRPATISRRIFKVHRHQVSRSRFLGVAQTD